MFDPYRNRDEHRPFGEETPFPDHELGRDSDAANEFFTDGNYPDPADRTEFSCRNCRQAVPVDRTRCGYCGTSHSPQRNTLDRPERSASYADSSDTHRDSQPSTGADREDWQQVIFAVVEATSTLAAIAKGSVACSYLVGADDTVATCRPVDEFDSPPPADVTEPWDHLPAATAIDSPGGRRLLRQAIDRTPWPADPVRPPTVIMDGLQTHLYDETGAKIRSRSTLAGLEVETATSVWLVPAIAAGSHPDRASMAGQSTRAGSPCEALPCHDCHRPTVHAFDGLDDIPHRAAPGQPIWQCRTCRTYRYGPMPDVASRPIAGRSHDARTMT